MSARGAITIAASAINSAGIPDRIKLANTHALKHLAKLVEGHEKALTYCEGSGYEAARPYARRRFLATTRGWDDLSETERMDLRKRCQQAGMEFPEHCRVDKDGTPFEDLEALKAYSEAQLHAVEQAADQLVEDCDVVNMTEKASRRGVVGPQSFDTAWPRLSARGLDGAEVVDELMETFTGNRYLGDSLEPRVIRREDGEARAYASASLPTPGEGEGE